MSDTNLPAAPAAHPRGLAKVRGVLGEELGQLHLHLRLAEMVLAPLPVHVGARLRTRVLRMAGFTIGHGTVFWDVPRLTGGADIYRNLRIGNLCRFNIGSAFELGAPITIGDLCGFGPQVMVLTTTHELGAHERRSAAPHSLPVTIGAGVWVGARATILPGVTVGDGSVIAAGAVVNRDVPPDTVVAGVPAKVVKTLT